ncbi:MAG: hypothetical protein DRJ03_26805 [Chloroflexi bacterium]|nr:MAG: hypothetical protein DRJ03_26805 [Chloroflexota bacterium]
MAWNIASEVKQDWTLILRVGVKITSGTLRKLQERYWVKRGAHIYHRVADINLDVQVFNHEDLKQGMLCEIQVEKRGDGRKRITFYPRHPTEISIDPRTLWSQVLKWAGVCDAEREAWVNILCADDGEEANDDN